jgi:tetratricopeptide (TPR) repeat protein
LTLDKFLLLLNAYEIPQAENFAFFKKFIPMFTWPLLSFSILGPLGLLGLSISLGRWKNVYFLLSYVLSIMVGTALFFVLSRFRIQICSAFMVFAAFSIVWLWEKLRARQWRPLAMAVAALLFFAFIVHRPHPALNPARDEARARTYLAKYHWFVEKDLRKAEAELHLALEADSLLGDTYLYLAKLRLEEGRIQETFQLWRKAVQMDPEVSGAHLNVGNLYRQMGWWDKAIDEYRQEIMISPYSYDAYLALSEVMAEKEKQFHPQEKKSMAGS